MIWIKGIPSQQQIDDHKFYNPGGYRVGGGFARSKTIHIPTIVGSNWLVRQTTEEKYPYPRTVTTLQIIYLTVYKDDIYVANGRSFWQPLAETTWAKDCEYAPITYMGEPAKIPMPEEEKVTDGWTAKFKVFEDSEGCAYEPNLAEVLKDKSGRILAHVQIGSGPYDRCHVFNEKMDCVYSNEVGAGEGWTNNDTYKFKAAKKWCLDVIESQYGELGVQWPLNLTEKK